MVSHDVFKVKQMSGYDLCHFYQVGESGDLPPFPSSCLLAACERLSDFLHKARAEGQSQLIVVHTSDSVTVVSLLSDLHNKTSLHHLPLEGKGRTGSKHLSCPFWLYMDSNKTYMNHIISGHYDAVYSCGKCLDKVTVWGQQMSSHFKHCKGLKTKPAGPEKVSDDAAGHSGDATAGKGRDWPKKKKKKMKSCEKSPSVLPPTGSVVSPQHSACTVTASPKMKSPMRSGKHSSKHGKDHKERATKRPKDTPKKDAPSKGKACSKDKTDSDKLHKKRT